MSPHLERWRARRSERGNALLIVVMVITLMTAVGMYSMTAASLAEQAIGFNRLSVQTTYVAEFAARSVVAELVGKEKLYFEYVARGTDDCRANSQLVQAVEAYEGTERPPCYKLMASEMWNRFNTSFPGNAGGSVGSLFGDMSRAETSGNFVVEMTDMARAGGPIAGEDVGNSPFMYMQMLLSATGQVSPGDLSGNACNAAFSSSSGLQTLRAQVTFGPVN